jgi:hypothetical protein
MAGGGIIINDQNIADGHICCLVVVSMSALRIFSLFSHEAAVFLKVDLKFVLQIFGVRRQLRIDFR